MEAAAPPGFHSLTDERVATLPVEGTLPDWLTGSVARNGPGAFELGPTSVDHWFDGLAMLHRYSFDGPRDEVTYRNRFLRSDAYRRAREGRFDGGFATGSSTLRERLAALLFAAPYDNANVVAERVGDRYLAFTESPRAVEFDPRTLATRGSTRFAGTAPAGQLSCAHFRRDPRTDVLLGVDTAFGRPSTYHVYEQRRPDVRSQVAAVEVDRPAYMHSFAATPSYVVLTEFPLVVDPLSFLTPGRLGPFIEAYEWEPERGTRFVVLDRRTGDVVATPVAEPCFGFHHVNAYEDGADVVLDLETVPDADAIGALDLDALRAGELDAAAGRLERFRVRDPRGTAHLERRRLHDGGTALPTISPAVRMRRHRYVYAQATDRPVREWPRAVVKVDVETGGTRRFADADAGVEGAGHPSEPLFVPRPGGDAEDDGVVVTVLLDVERETSLLLVLDGGTLAERARVRLPHAIPFDFHGRYFPEL